MIPLELTITGVYQQALHLLKERHQKIKELMKKSDSKKHNDYYLAEMKKTELALEEVKELHMKALIDSSDGLFL